MDKNKEAYYREDFRCFKHYVLATEILRPYKKDKIITPISFDKSKSSSCFWFKKQPSCNNDYYTYQDVLIFDEIPKIDLTKFFEPNKNSYSYYNDKYFFSNKCVDFIEKYKKEKRLKPKFFLKKLNRNWEVSKLSEEKYFLTVDGKKIYYRLATIKINKKDNILPL